jgi:hypothetical protein
MLKETDLIKFAEENGLTPDHVKNWLNANRKKKVAITNRQTLEKVFSFCKKNLKEVGNNHPPLYMQPILTRKDEIWFSVSPPMGGYSFNLILKESGEVDIFQEIVTYPHMDEVVEFQIGEGLIFRASGEKQVKDLWLQFCTSGRILIRGAMKAYPTSGARFFISNPKERTVQRNPIHPNGCAELDY